MLEDLCLTADNWTMDHGSWIMDHGLEFGNWEIATCNLSSTVKCLTVFASCGLYGLYGLWIMDWSLG